MKPFFLFLMTKQYIEESFRRGDNRPKDILMIDKKEIEQLNNMIKDLKEKGPTSSTFRSIVEAYFPLNYFRYFFRKA